MSDHEARAALRALQMCDWSAISGDEFTKLLRAVNAERARRLVAGHGDSRVTIRTRFEVRDGQAAWETEDIETQPVFQPIFLTRGPGGTEFISRSLGGDSPNEGRGTLAGYPVPENTDLLDSLYGYTVPGLGATHRLLASAHCVECGGSRSIRPGTNDEGSIPCPRCQA